ncbi:MAG TPA: hypothetical protein VMV48_00365 [Gallionellaceae bacterium]|nr:hypothetical protein [Gallionellaceae bacterium]
MNHSQPYAAKTPAQGTPRDAVSRATMNGMKGVLMGLSAGNPMHVNDFVEKHVHTMGVMDSKLGVTQAGIKLEVCKKGIL